MPPPPLPPGWRRVAGPLDLHLLDLSGSHERWCTTFAPENAKTLLEKLVAVLPLVQLFKSVPSAQLLGVPSVYKMRRIAPFIFEALRGALLERVNVARRQLDPDARPLGQENVRVVGNRCRLRLSLIDPTDEQMASCSELGFGHNYERAVATARAALEALGSKVSKMRLRGLLARGCVRHFDDTCGATLEELCARVTFLVNVSKRPTYLFVDEPWPGGATHCVAIPPGWAVCGDALRFNLCKHVVGLEAFAEGLVPRAMLRVVIELTGVDVATIPGWLPEFVGRVNVGDARVRELVQEVTVAMQQPLTQQPPPMQQQEQEQEEQQLQQHDDDNEDNEDTDDDDDNDADVAHDVSPEEENEAAFGDLPSEEEDVGCSEDGVADD